MVGKKEVLIAKHFSRFLRPDLTTSRVTFDLTPTNDPSSATYVVEVSPGELPLPSSRLL